MTNTTKRDWVRIIGITGAALVVAGAVTMGGLWAATATGVIDAPTARAGLMSGRGGKMNGFGEMGGRGGRGGMMGDHDEMGGRGGMMGDHDEMSGRGGKMNGFGEMGGRGGRGGMMGNHDEMGGRGGMMGGYSDGFAQQTGDQAILAHLLVTLQKEQATANLLADTNTAAKAIADSRSKDIEALTALQTSWFPDATVPSTTVATATIDDLKELLLHNTSMMEHLSDATFEHPELATWLTQNLTERATQIASLYGQQS